MDNTNKTIIGKDVIESLTLGMYGDARIIYREYIQNAADQIDKAVKHGILSSTSEGKIWIYIDKQSKKIVIEDNATGVSSKEAVSILKNIAQSTKQRGVDKGFRGIGRLGGLAYCDKLTYETSCHGEDKKTVIEWDAKLLKSIINNRHDKETAADVIDKITNILEIDEKADEHYFKVTLENISNSNLLEVGDIRKYLSMVAPTSVHPRFTFFSKINKFFNEKGIVDDEYNIVINGEQLYKDYTTKIYELPGKTFDEIKDLLFFDGYSQDGQLLLSGWYGYWSYIKQIPEKGNPARGIRLRKSNIQIGDEYTLAKFFPNQESRWNFYTFGEVHAVHPELIPNARRDYFLENACLKEFEAFLTKQFKELYDAIYFSSNIRSAKSDISKLDEINVQLHHKQQKGFKSQIEKEALIQKQQEQVIKAEKAKEKLSNFSEKSKENDVKARIYAELVKGKEILAASNGSQTDYGLLDNEKQNKESTIKEKSKFIFIDDDSLPRQNREERKLIKKVFDVVDTCLPDKALVENIRQKIVEEFNKNRQGNG